MLRLGSTCLGPGALPGRGDRASPGDFACNVWLINSYFGGCESAISGPAVQCSAQTPDILIEHSPFVMQGLCGALADDRYAASVCALFDGKSALVKTVKNHDWLHLVHSFRGKPFRTPTSLPPRHGVGMSLFGSVDKGCVGVVWNKNMVDLSKAFIWPSGYFAKSEHNLVNGDQLLQGREKALVSWERLISDNASLAYTETYSGARVAMERGQLLPYNEVNFYCSINGLVAIFLRSFSSPHVLFAMSVATLLKRLLGRPLPLLFLDGTHAVRPITWKECYAAVQEYQANICDPSRSSRPPSARAHYFKVFNPRLPFEIELSPKMSAMQIVGLHASYGITSSSLAKIISVRDVSSSLPLVSHGFQMAASELNPPSARELVRALTPPLLKHLESRSTPTLHRLLHRFLSDLQAIQEEQLFKMATSKGTAVEAAQGILVALGAQLMAVEFLIGDATTRVETAITEMKMLISSAHPSCVADFKALMTPDVFIGWFRMQACYAQALGVKVLFNGDAVALQKRFLRGLESLLPVKDGKHFVQKIFELVGSSQPPDWQLQILRDVIGLDERLPLGMVYGVICLAADVFTTRPASPFDVDESTVLEADARNLLLPAERPTFSSDPLMESKRVLRANCTYR